MTSNPEENGTGQRFWRRLRSPGLIFFVITAIAGLWIGIQVPPTWTVEKVGLDVSRDAQGQLVYTYQGKPKPIENVVPMAEAQLRPERIERLNADGQRPTVTEEYVWEEGQVDGRPARLYSRLVARFHWGFWSLLPAAVAVGLCWLTREPLPALLGGIVVGAFLLGRYNLTGQVLISSFAS
ncbi:MAG: hypothetical protein JW818_20870, partial [Pirellulales bacterium]|nr:hypothetical protein [Pirellulales bacterium]